MKISFKVFFFDLFISSVKVCYGENERSDKISAVSEKKNEKFKPDWDDLNKRIMRMPEWYDRAKIGILIHWGVYTVPGYGTELIWFHWKRHGHIPTTCMNQVSTFACRDDFLFIKKMIQNDFSLRLPTVIEKNQLYEEFSIKTYPPGFIYEEFAPMFKAEFFNPRNMAKLFARSGAQYVVLTTMHHGGFVLFPSKNSFAWNSVDAEEPHRDIVKELSQAVKQAGLGVEVYYYSMYEWFNPLFLSDQKSNFSQYVEAELWPDIQQLILDYKPSLVWADGDWTASDKYWGVQENY